MLTCEQRSHIFWRWRLYNFCNFTADADRLYAYEQNLNMFKTIFMHAACNCWLSAYEKPPGLRCTKVDALITQHSTESVFFIFQPSFLLQDVISLIATTFCHSFNTSIPRFKGILNFYLIKIVPHLRCHSLESINGSRLAVEKLPFKQPIHTEIHYGTIWSIRHPVLFGNEVNSAILKPFLGLSSRMRRGVVLMENRLDSSSAKHFWNVLFTQRLQEMFDVMVCIDFRLWFNKAKFRFPPITDARETHNALWMWNFPKLSPTFFRFLPFKFVVDSTLPVCSCQVNPALIHTYTFFEFCTFQIS